MHLKFIRQILPSPEFHSHCQQVQEVGGGSKENPIRVPSTEGSKSKREPPSESFKEVLIGEIDSSEVEKGLKLIAALRREGGNIVAELDVENYSRDVQELQYSVVGKLTMMQGEMAPTNMNIKKKLQAAWGLKDFKVIPLRGGVYHILLDSLQDQSIVMAKGASNMHPGVFSVSRWYPGFNPAKYIITTSQVWIRPHNLPLEYRKQQNILNIAGGVRLTLKINPLPISLYHKLYARVFVDIDFTQPLPETILVKMIHEESKLNISRFVSIEYKKLPKFCSKCFVFSHKTSECKNGRNNFTRQEYKDRRID